MSSALNSTRLVEGHELVKCSYAEGAVFGCCTARCLGLQPDLTEIARKADAVGEIVSHSQNWSIIV